MGAGREKWKRVVEIVMAGIENEEGRMIGGGIVVGRDKEES